MSQVSGIVFLAALVLVLVFVLSPYHSDQMFQRSQLLLKGVGALLLRRRTFLVCGKLGPNQANLSHPSPTSHCSSGAQQPPPPIWNPPKSLPNGWPTMYIVHPEDFFFWNLLFRRVLADLHFSVNVTLLSQMYLALSILLSCQKRKITYVSLRSWIQFCPKPLTIFWRPASWKEP